MVRQQRTIETSFTYEGTGLHTGKRVRTVFNPAPPGTGIIFRRVDLDPVVEIRAIAKNIPDSDPIRNTTIASNGALIHTVEHILAAASGLQVDNLLIDIDADEAPEPRDGSCSQLVELIGKAGITEQGAPMRPLKITTPVSWEHDDVELIALPHDGFRVSFTCLLYTSDAADE